MLVKQNLIRILIELTKPYSNRINFRPASRKIERHPLIEHHYGGRVEK